MRWSSCAILVRQNYKSLYENIYDRSKELKIVFHVHKKSIKKGFSYVRWKPRMDNPLKWDIFIKVSGRITSNGCGSKVRYFYWEFELFFSYYFFIKKINIYVSVQKVVCCSHQSNRLGYVSRTNQIAALGYVSRTNQSVVFVLWFERCSNFNEVMVDSERAVCKMESYFRMRNVGFPVFLTCILPRFMRNAILLDRWKISDYL